MRALTSSARAARACVRSASTSAGAAAALPSFARGLFDGKITSAAVYPYPSVDAEVRETVGQLVPPTAQFFKEVNNAAANDETASVPAEVSKALGEMGAFGLQIPTENGGLGLTNSGYARLVEVVGGADLGVGIYLGAHQSIGLKGIILYGTPEQKAKYLPDLATGKNVAAFALTEPCAGSDAAGIKTRATLSEDGKHYIINGAKIWISNGGIAEIFTLFAKMEVVDPKTGEKKDKMGAFIVERSFGGVTSGPPEKKMGIKCSNTAEVYFDNVKVPVENLLGKPGDGFRIAMGILNNGRFGMGAALTGTMKTVIQSVSEHAVVRKQFGRELSSYGLIKSKLATMASKLYATESLAYMLAANMDRGQEDYQIEAACSKVLASESAWSVTDEAIQIMGGLGFMKALPYERVLRDLRIFRIFEGANDILRLMIGLTGIQSYSKEVLGPISAAMKAPLSNLPTVVPFALTLAKSRLGIYEKPSLSWAPAPLRPAATIIEDATGDFGDAVRGLVMNYKKDIIERQMEVERVADVVIDLTAATAAVSRAAKAYASKTGDYEHEVALANLFAEEAKFRLAANLKAIRGGQSGLNKMRTSVADKIVASTTSGVGAYTPSHPLGM